MDLAQEIARLTLEKEGVWQLFRKATLRADIAESILEAALADAERYRWIVPILDGINNNRTSQRAMALDKAIFNGLRGNEAVDFARKQS